ncbi:unknown [Brachyspira sp. CAG:484]|nr:unknown [Brachyspira sp. CAG:484]
MSVDDVLNIVREYQVITHKSCCYEHTRELLEKADFFIPEDL